MRIHSGFLIVFGLAFAAVSFAQQWEIGMVGGGGFSNGVSVSTATASGTTGFNSGAAIGVVAAGNRTEHLSGEVRYTYLVDDLKVSSSGTTVTFAGASHAVNYDFVYYPAAHRSKVQPYLAAGAGIRIFRGTGTEAAFQPLSNLVFLTKTQDLRPLFVAGGGLKYRISEHVVFRGEFYDYISTFPVNVITPAPGAKVGSWLQTFVPLAGLSFLF